METDLLDLKVLGAQRLDDLLLRPVDLLSHRGSEPVEHPLERELLHLGGRAPARRRGLLLSLTPGQGVFYPALLSYRPLLSLSPLALARTTCRLSLGAASHMCSRV